MVDVEFDNVDDVPEILNSLKIKVQAEKFNVKNDKIRTASLLPKQVCRATLQEFFLPQKSFLLLPLERSPPLLHVCSPLPPRRILTHFS